MMEIKSLKDKIMSFEKKVNNDNLETTKSFISNFTSAYYFIFSNKTLTFLTHPAESNKLFAFVKLLV